MFDYQGPLWVCFCIQDCGCDFIGVCSACILEQEGSGHTVRHLLIGREFVCLRMFGALWGCAMVAQVTVGRWNVCWAGRETQGHVGDCEAPM